jgi:hypothetical protein
MEAPEENCTDEYKAPKKKIYLQQTMDVHRVVIS